jgi:hypothetical protein
MGIWENGGLGARSGILNGSSGGFTQYAFNYVARDAKSRLLYDWVRLQGMGIDCLPD